MLSEGTEAPAFELPGLVDGERRRVSLGEFLGDDVVILAFYPADFNPACDETSCGLDELDLFTMQKDVTILGISPDSVHSHRAFADRYDLKVPLLADTDGAVAEAYDLGFVDDIGQHLLERAVAVVDHDGVVRYAWHTDDPTVLPDVEPIKDAIADTGGDDTAFARYRVGHAHYTEGRRAFTSAMDAFGDSEWMLAQSDFQRAREEFAEAESQFDTAVRFGDDDSLSPVYEGAKTKASALWQAADWLAGSASAYSSGSGARGQELRDDAERPLGTARDYEEPPDPDGPWPPAVDDLTTSAPDDGDGILPAEEPAPDATLDVDIDDASETVGGDQSERRDDGATGAVAEDGPAEGDPSVAGADDGDHDAIGDDEIAEIQAELEATDPEPTPEAVTEEPTSMVDAPPTPDDAEGGNGGSTAAGDASGPAAPDRRDDGPDTPDTDGTDADDAAADGPDAGADDEPAADGELELTDPAADDRDE
ncbi:redoxin domain-containing protein [Haloarcula litorea]|uniref:redoxin domain-containing protein n=1 Tax=Haloarcula litorea TaxID=3032579 RepID=UPI0023E8261B|nr:redoxin domain-containing protein [Halomicroarcula sp. GDY20]